MPSDVPTERLQDIITNIDRIRAHLTGIAPGNKLDDKTRDAVERCLERISEAAKKLGSMLEDHQPHIQWRSIRGLGNVLRHEYDVVEDTAIQNIIDQELGPLRQACVDELAVLKGQRHEDD